MPAPSAMPSTAPTPGLGPATPAEWSAELISSLDWLRMAELVRAVATQGGCELAGSRVLANGAVIFGMLEQPSTPYPQRALVKVSGWNEWGATPEGVTRFAQEVSTAKNTRGILIAPAGFSPAALLTAQEHRVEAVDAAGLCAVLKTLPEERSQFLLTIATTGDFTRPTCPICLGKLQVENSALQSQPPTARVITERGLYAEHVICDALEIAAEAEVEFLYPVQARTMRVFGRAMGDFSSEGTLTIEAGGMLDGRIAARSIQVEEGGELRGQFRILEGGNLQPFATPPARWHWRCPSLRGKPGCLSVVFDPHS